MKVFMFNHSGSLNRGCEAIVRGTVTIINNTFEENEFILSSYAPQEDKVLTDIVKAVQFEPRILTKTEHCIAALKFRIKNDERFSVIKSYSSFFDDAHQADICLSVGGDTYCYGDNIVIRILTDELRRRGKKLVLWGVSIGKEDLTVEKEKNLACFDAIFARETLTYELIKNKKINPNVFLFPDPAFAINNDEMSLPIGWQEKNTLGLNLSPIVAAKNPNILRITSEFIKRILRNTDMSVALIPHVTSPENNDMVLLKTLFNENKNEANGRLLLMPADLNAEQYKGYIARLRFFIGARTHATIEAYTSFVPTLVLGYSVKSRGISIDFFDDERFVLDVGSLQSSDELFRAFEDLWEQESYIRNRLTAMVPDKIQDAFAAGTKLMEI